jgi:hypothetical protein
MSKQFLNMSFHMYLSVEVTLSSVICLLFKFSITFRLMWVTEAKVITKDTHTHTQSQPYKQKNFVSLLCIAL